MTAAPPTGRVRLAQIRDQALSVEEVLAAVADPGSGGTAVFVGTVRDEDEAHGVRQLSYSAHPSAQAELERVAAEVAAAHPVRAVAAVHRVGDLAVGELAVVAAVAAPHRGEAFTACRALIDTVKEQVPLWKRQVFTDGTVSWVGVD